MSKLPHVGTTIFTEMSLLAKQTNAINLSQGFPNFPVDERLTEILKNKSTQDIHQYMPMAGSPELIDQIQQLTLKSYDRTIGQNEVLITAGATQGIFSTIIALVKNGDEVIILDPSYDCYEPAIVLAGGIPIRIQLNDDYTPNWNAIEEKFSDKTKMIITNNPHNPSGRIWEESDYLNLEELLNTFPSTILLSDEVYVYITFEKGHISANQRPNLLDRTIVVSSFGKTFHITGWKMGYIVAPEKLLSEIKKVHQFNVFSVNSVAQSVLTDYLKIVDVKSLGAFYQTKRDLFQNLLSKSNFRCLQSEGTYFQLVDYSSISKIDDVSFCKELAIKHGVAAIPVSVFSQQKTSNQHIRFCYAKDDETLFNASEKLCQI